MHNLILEGRKKLQLGGVKDCRAFSEELVALETEMGLLKVKGERLKIESFSVETGELLMHGRIIALGYFETGKGKSKLTARIFK
ncbi:MAG: sporulation protein YabP [Oscillospiraceae bacterium]|nr:sporulation protein YabP [Candidatus Equicaccousia limihippi]